MIELEKAGYGKRDGTDTDNGTTILAYLAYAKY